MSVLGGRVPCSLLHMTVSFQGHPPSSPPHPTTGAQALGLHVCVTVSSCARTRAKASQLCAASLTLRAELAPSAHSIVVRDGVCHSSVPSVLSRELCLLTPPPAAVPSGPTHQHLLFFLCLGMASFPIWSEFIRPYNTSTCSLRALFSWLHKLYGPHLLLP